MGAPASAVTVDAQTVSGGIRSTFYSRLGQNGFQRTGTRTSEEGKVPRNRRRR